jgi:chemotaxis-related protein WspB
VLFLLFELDTQRYALDTARIHEVLPLVEIRAIPKAPPAVAGVIEYRGATLPVIDLSELALGRPAARRLSTRIVLVQHTAGDGSERPLGLILEKVTRTLRCEPGEFQPSGLSRAGAPYLGPLASSPAGLVQRLELSELLTPGACAALFEAAAGV